MARLGYDAVGVGEMDLGHGLDALVEDVRDHGLNVTCANLMRRGDREPAAAPGPAAEAGRARAEAHGTVFPPYLVIERGGLRVGFVAVLSPSTRVRAAGSPDAAVEALTWAIEDPRAAAAAVAEARAACDLLVLLAHVEQSELDALLPELSGVDLVVLGHDPHGQPLVDARAGEDVPVVRASSQGQNIGRLRAAISGHGALEGIANRIYFLDATYEADPETAALVEAFEAENREVQKTLYAREQLRASRHGERPGNVYLGLGACHGCHAEDFEVYAKTAHAHAYRTVSEQFVHRDTNCVGCHVTGWGERGGFDGLRLRGAQADLVDVQCEACHGPGAEHARDGSYRTRAIQSCVKCHTPHEDPDFDFAKDWPKVAH
ncbi:MAG: multiheme c-type cytochrome [Candidatus Krumholzibacteria bacterium]|nr:multiheme c-type cytochrome [Candidatus Krumholzibacteria bacterium]